MADAPFVSLYRRFRPGQFDELRGQDHVVRALRSAVRDDRVSHAYLFSGPRGTGKTSSARILAKALNCEAPVDGEPCGICTSCVEITQGTSLNVHELDAASNNGVDAMRDLVAHAGLGTPGRWKVYIVDEVHMLSTAAANALLKTLEEPPSHVVFVLATTDPQKVPPTIRSRTQHLEFRLLGAETLHDLLESINEEAGLHVDEGALEAAVRRGRGSARDALSALDQVVASGSADAARPELAAVIDALADGDVGQVLVSLSGLLAGGWGPQQLGTELIDDLRQVFLAALAPELCTVSGQSLERFRSVAEAMGLARVVRSMEILGHALVDMREAPDAQVVLEIAAVRAVRPDLDSGMEALSERVSVLERAQSGSPAFPRPGAAPDRGATAKPEAGNATAAPAAPATPTEPRSPAEVSRRPSLGAMRRSKEAATAPAPADTATPDAMTAPVPSPVPPETGRVMEPAPAAPDRAAAAPAAPAAPAAQGAHATAVLSLDRDSLTEAWGDGILQSLPARAKARYASGRFVAVDDQGVHFALPNAAHREQCAEQQPVVEAALSDHFGTKVTLVLDIDDAGSPPAPGPGPSPAASGRAPGGRPPAPVPTVEEAEYVDPSELEDASADQASAAEARLLQAFPGASEVAE
ncbi:MAG TPA: DNA polymerase III subunit gamma/tau [Acidimicrobiales bacterium]|jgi:DNA polymerase-3 subunit gamma/tau|nr:DNA polymerase III subunit gamma/tau [Acidimicrobiales bacterium]